MPCEYFNGLIVVFVLRKKQRRQNMKHAMVFLRDRSTRAYEGRTRLWRGEEEPREADMWSAIHCLYDLNGGRYDDGTKKE